MNLISPLYLGASAVIGIACAVAGLASGGDVLEGWGAASRYTARWASLLFLVPFATSGLRAASGGAIVSWLARHRRGTGLAFALAFGIHAVVFTLAMRNGFPVARVTVIGGSVVYAFVAALALTSTNAAQRAMGRGWKRLHTFGLWLVWVNFVIVYQGGLAVPDPTRHVVSTMALVLLVGLALLRVAGPRLRRPA